MAATRFRSNRTRTLSTATRRSAARLGWLQPPDGNGGLTQRTRRSQRKAENSQRKMHFLVLLFSASSAFSA